MLPMLFFITMKMQMEVEYLVKNGTKFLCFPELYICVIYLDLACCNSINSDKYSKAVSINTYHTGIKYNTFLKMCVAGLLIMNV